MSLVLDLGHDPWSCEEAEEGWTDGNLTLIKSHLRERSAPQINSPGGKFGSCGKSWKTEDLQSPLFDERPQAREENFDAVLAGGENRDRFASLLKCQPPVKLEDPHRRRVKKPRGPGWRS